MGRKIEIELPDPETPAVPDLATHPMIGDLRERLARLEERTTSEGVDPAAAEALRLAGEARQLADAAKSQSDRVAAQLEKDQPTAPVIEVHPPAPAPLASPELEPDQEHHPWWHPKRWL